MTTICTKKGKLADTDENDPTTAKELAQEFQSTARVLGRKLGGRRLVKLPDSNIPIASVCVIEALTVKGEPTKKGYSTPDKTVYCTSAVSENGKLRRKQRPDLDASWREDVGAFGTVAGWAAWDKYGEAARLEDAENKAKRDEAGDSVDRLLAKIEKLDTEDFDRVKAEICAMGKARANTAE